MARLPTVKLRHRKTGKMRVVNQTDYARDLTKWADWEIFSMRSGDATQAEVYRDKAESDLNKFRINDATRQKWSGDAERAFNSRSIVAITE